MRSRGCAVGGVRAGTDGVTDDLLNATQVLLDDGGFTRKVLIERPFGYRRFAGESLDTGGVDALAVEQVGGRIEDALSGAAAAASIGGACLTLGGHSPSIPMGLHRLQRRVASAESKYTDRYTRSET